MFATETNRTRSHQELLITKGKKTFPFFSETPFHSVVFSSPCGHHHINSHIFQPEAGTTKDKIYPFFLSFSWKKKEQYLLIPDRQTTGI